MYIAGPQTVVHDTHFPPKFDRCALTWCVHKRPRNWPGKWHTGVLLPEDHEMVHKMSIP